MPNYNDYIINTKKPAPKKKADPKANLAKVVEQLKNDQAFTSAMTLTVMESILGPKKFKEFITKHGTKLEVSTVIESAEYADDFAENAETCAAGDGCDKAEFLACLNIAKANNDEDFKKRDQLEVLLRDYDNRIYTKYKDEAKILIDETVGTAADKMQVHRDAEVQDVGTQIKEEIDETDDEGRTGKEIEEKTP